MRAFQRFAFNRCWFVVWMFKKYTLCWLHAYTCALPSANVSLWLLHKPGRPKLNSWTVEVDVNSLVSGTSTEEVAERGERKGKKATNHFSATLCGVFQLTSYVRGINNNNNDFTQKFIYYFFFHFCRSLLFDFLSSISRYLCLWYERTEGSGWYERMVEQTKKK